MKPTIQTELKKAWNKFLTREYSWAKYRQVCKEVEGQN